jgi:hypothetical protein
MHTDPHAASHNDWWQQVDCNKVQHGSRGSAALTVRVEGCQSDRLVRLNRLTLFTVYDEVASDRNLVVRFGAFRPRRIPNGIEWAGRDSAILFKDLSLRPCWGAKGQRLDLRDTSLLRIAWGLNRSIEHATQGRPMPRLRRLRLPSVLAAFLPGAVGSLQGRGPEFEAICKRFGMAPARMFRLFQRRHQGFTLCPLDWLDEEQLQRAKAFFADLDGYPRKQLFRVHRFPDQLQGYQGACAFDFYANRFRPAD